MIPIHATATVNPQQLRWVAAADRLPARGTVRAAPGRLGALLERGVIQQIVIRAADVLIALGADHSWRELGDEIREALCDALPDPAASTLSDKLQHELRRQSGQQITVFSQNHSATTQLGKKLLSLIVR